MTDGHGEEILLRIRQSYTTDDSELQERVIEESMQYFLSTKHERHLFCKSETSALILSFLIVVVSGFDVDFPEEQFLSMRECMYSCTDCLVSYHLARAKIRKHFITLKKVPYKSIQLTMDKPAKWEAEYLFRCISEAIENSVNVEEMTKVVTKVLKECLLNPKILRLHSKLKVYFDNCTSHLNLAHQDLSKFLKIYPGLIYLLFEGDDAQRNWALSVLPYEKLSDDDNKLFISHFTEKDFSSLIAEEYEIHFFNIQRPDFYTDDKAIKFWTNIIPLIRFSSKEADKKCLFEPFSTSSYRDDAKIRIISLMEIFINHIFSYLNEPLPFLLRFLSLVLEKYSNSLFDLIKPHNYMSFFDMAFNNPSYKKFLTTLSPDIFPNSQRELDSLRSPLFVDLFKWMQVCINLLSDPNSCQFSIAMFSFMSDFMKQPSCGKFVGAYIMDTMANQLKLKNNSKSESINIELTYKSSARDLINKKSIVLFDATQVEMLKPKAIRLIQTTLSFDIETYSFHSYKLMKNQETITPDFNNTLWNLLQTKLPTSGTDAVISVLSAFQNVYRVFPIDVPYKKTKLSNTSEKTDHLFKNLVVSCHKHNRIIFQFTDSIQNVLNKLAEYLNPVDMKLILQTKEASKGFWSCIVSPVDKVYESSIAFLYEAFDVDDRLEAFRGYLSLDLALTLDSLKTALANFTTLELFLPTQRIVKLLIDFIAALFDPMKGILVTSKLGFSTDLQTSTMQFWVEVWKFLGMVFKNIFDWSITYEKLKATLSRDAADKITSDLLNFTRDVLDLSHSILNGYQTILSVINFEDHLKGDLCALKTSLLQPIIDTLSDLFKWLRLSDSALLIRCVDLIKKILDLSHEINLVLNDSLLEILVKLCLRAKKFNNKMTIEQTGELLLRARDINSTLVEDISTSVETEKKKKLEQQIVEVKPEARSEYQYVPRSTHATGSKQQSLGNFLKPYVKESSPMLLPPKRLSKLEEAQLKLKEKRSAPAMEPAPARPSGFNKKKPISISDSDSDSDQSDGEGNHGLFTKDQVVAKMKKSKAALQSLQLPRFGNSVTSPKPNKNKELSQRKKDEELMRLRLNVDMTPLYKTILSWSYNNDKELPSDYDESKYSAVKDQFESVRDYQQTFEPLLLLECWQSIQRAKQVGSETPFRMTIGSRSATDSFFDIYASVKKEIVNEIRCFGDNDLLVLMLIDGLPDDDAGFGIPKRLVDTCKINCFAKVREIKNASRTLCDITLRVSSENNSLVHKITSGMELVGLKVNTMTTLEREFSSLKGLQYYDLSAEIFKAIPGTLENISDEKIKKLKNVYDVNDSQAKAISGTVNGKGFSLIQGPPGTGKTKTILGVIGYSLTQDDNTVHRVSVPSSKLDGGMADLNSKRKILICAPSNAAVDELVLRIRNGIKNSKGDIFKPNVVRLGKSDAINEQVKDLTLEEQVDKQLSKLQNNDDSAIKEEHRKCLNERDELRKQLESGKLSDTEITKIEMRLQDVMRKRRELGKRLDELREQKAVNYRNREIERRNLQYKILNNAQVVCSTLSGSAHDVLAGMSLTFETVVIDEAAQCIELSAIIPLRYGCKKCIMVGDPNQLPPTVLSQKAALFKYEQSLFVRMQNNHKDAVYLLDVQYRMHPEISKFPSKEFYDSRLKDGPDMATKTFRPWHEIHEYGPYRFFNIKGQQMRNERTQSLFNNIECRVILEIIEDLYRKFPQINWANKIGVISPYKEQVRLLKKTFSERYGQLILKQIDFNTVDGFQGQEKDIILFSCVRAEQNSGVGFLADIRRMNVALTRARASLWVIGSIDALVSNKTWRDLFNDAKVRNLVTECYLGFTRSLGNSSKYSRNKIAKNKIEDITKRESKIEKKSSGVILPQKRRADFSTMDTDSGINTQNMKKLNNKNPKNGMIIKKSSGQITKDMKMVKGPKASGVIPLPSNSNSLPNKPSLPEGMVKISKKKTFMPSKFGNSKR